MVQSSVTTPASDEQLERRFDPSRRAEDVLDYVLDDSPKKAQAPTQPRVSVDTELRARKIIDHDTGRTMSRVLFVTTDESVRTKGSRAQGEYLALASLFNEIHIMVLVPREGTDSHERCADNVWVYTVHDTYWFTVPFEAKGVAREQLVFGGSVRPDLVVGVDPFEAGFAAQRIGKDLKRPVQIHVATDFTKSQYIKQSRSNRWRARIARYVLKRAQSVRTERDALQEVVQQFVSLQCDLATLPQFYNFQSYRDAVPTQNIHDVYKEYSFIMLAFGPFTADSHLHDLFTVVRATLLNPRIGLVVIGEGPARGLFEEKVRLLGIERNVVFKQAVEDIFSYYKTADVLIETDTSKESEEHVFRAAAAGLPIIARETDVRRDLFKDGESAFLCPADDSVGMAQKITKFINTPALRTAFRNQAQSIVTDRLEEDPVQYYRALRDSIEVVLADANDNTDEKTPSPHTNS